MATIEYTAKRTLAGGHVANATYVIDLEIRSALPSRTDVKEIARAPSGAMETTFERRDVTWSIRFAPVNGYDLELLREFLDSTESGELFRIWLWPEDTAPLALKRLEDGHTEDAFMRRGGEREDYFEAQLSALQVSPYDVTGTGVETGGTPGGGLGGGGGDTTDIYDPGVGGPLGFLDPDSGLSWNSPIVFDAEFYDLPGSTYDVGFSDSLSYGTLVSGGPAAGLLTLRTQSSDGGGTIRDIQLKLDITLPSGESMADFSGLTVTGGPTFLLADAEEYQPGDSWTWVYQIDDADPGGANIYDDFEFEDGLTYTVSVNP